MTRKRVKVANCDCCHKTITANTGLAMSLGTWSVRLDTMLFQVRDARGKKFEVCGGCIRDLFGWCPKCKTTREGYKRRRNPFKLVFKANAGRVESVESIIADLADEDPSVKEPEPSEPDEEQADREGSEQTKRRRSTDIDEELTGDPEREPGSTRRNLF